MKASEILLVETIAITLPNNLGIAAGDLMRMTLSCSIPHVRQKTARNEGDNDDTINNSDIGCIDDENEINNEESMDNRITDDCEDNESETRKEAAKDDEDSYTTGSDVDDNDECIEEQTSKEDDIAFDDTVLFPESNLTIRDIMIIVVAFSLRFKLSNVAKSALINMIKLLAGPKFEKINISKYTR